MGTFGTVCIVRNKVVKSISFCIKEKFYFKSYVILIVGQCLCEPLPSELLSFLLLLSLLLSHAGTPGKVNVL